MFLVLLRWKYVILGPTESYYSTWIFPAFLNRILINVQGNLTEPNLQKKIWIKERRFLHAQQQKLITRIYM